MNERIKLLAEQAGWTEAYYESDHGPLIEPEFNREKFAELIVKECANLNFRGTGFVCSEGEDMVRSMIKQHFGVRE